MSFAKQVGSSIKKAAPTILTAISTVGVVTTAVLVAKETPKALKRIEGAEKKREITSEEPLTKLEKAKEALPCYIPAIATCSATILCIIGTSVINHRRQASLIGAYSLLKSAYSGYQNEIKERFGVEAHEKALTALSEEDANRSTIMHTSGAFVYTTLDFGVKEEEHLFYDSFSERYFASTIGRVLQAEYYLNRMLTLNGSVSLNQFYDYLAIDRVEGGDDVGWWIDPENELYWVDFNHFVSQTDDGLGREPIDCLVIDYPYLPDVPPEDYI